MRLTHLPGGSARIVPEPPREVAVEGKAVGTTRVGMESTRIAVLQPVGAPGEDGRSFIPVEGIPSPSIGFNGDTAINITNGDEYIKALDAWTLTGRNFWGTLLIDAGELLEQTEESATIAINAAEEAEYWAHNPTFGDITIDGGFY